MAPSRGYNSIPIKLADPIARDTLVMLTEDQHWTGPTGERVFGKNSHGRVAEDQLSMQSVFVPVVFDQGEIEVHRRHLARLTDLKSTNAHEPAAIAEVMAEIEELKVDPAANSDWGQF